MIWILSAMGGFVIFATLCAARQVILMRGGTVPREPHKLDGLGSTPSPATTGAQPGATIPVRPDLDLLAADVSKRRRPWRAGKSFRNQRGGALRRWLAVSPVLRRMA